MTTGSLRFEGRIAGFGTAAGTRIVVGMWTRSPFGRFSDVMIENADGHRTLLAPTEQVARFVSSTYTFDEVRVVRVGLTRLGRTIRVVAGSLDASFTVGGVSPLGRLLRLVPGPIATRPDWLRLIDPVARLLVPGAEPRVLRATRAGSTTASRGRGASPRCTPRGRPTTSGSCGRCIRPCVSDSARRPRRRSSSTS
jgi:hypothetical protein